MSKFWIRSSELEFPWARGFSGWCERETRYATEFYGTVKQDHGETTEIVLAVAPGDVAAMRASLGLSAPVPAPVVAAKPKMGAGHAYLLGLVCGAFAVALFFALRSVPHA
jgi:hypothetical protein